MGLSATKRKFVSPESARSLTVVSDSFIILKNSFLFFDKICREPERSPKMTYREEDWQNVCRRLWVARQRYEEYQAQDKKQKDRDLLDDGVLKCWAFGEYAVNVVLEKSGLPVPQDHSQPSKAQDLFQSGGLQRDYSATLERLERFRKKASHLGYVKEASTHYSSADLKRCLDEMEALRAEVDRILRAGPSSR